MRIGVPYNIEPSVLFKSVEVEGVQKACLYRHGHNVLQRLLIVVYLGSVTIP